MYSSKRHPPLPSKKEHVWQGGTISPPRLPLRSVSAAGGMIVAVGGGMVIKRPGLNTIAACVFEPETLPFHVVAVEPWAPRRFAAASEEGITIFGWTGSREPVEEITLVDLEDKVTHLAWGRAGNVVTLFFLLRNGNLRAYNPSTNKVANPGDMPHFSALTSDATGRIAVLHCTNDDTVVYVLEDGETFVPRADEEAFYDPFDPANSPLEFVTLTMMGNSVAFSVLDLGIERSGHARVSWGKDEAFVDLVALSNGGALCFQNEQTLIGAYCPDDVAMVFRETCKGEISRLLEMKVMSTTEVTERPLIAIPSLAWDPTRRWVLGASPQIGLIKSEEPRPKSEKKRALA